MRIALHIAYDGTRYAGWQRQVNALAVQEVLEGAIRELAQDASIGIIGASRTDAGVHARKQVAHFDTDSRIPPEKWAYALNTRLPNDISVQSSIEVTPDFHSRYHSIGKIYHFRIYNAPHADPLNRLYAAHVPQQLNVKKLREEARSMVGRHDFSAFAASGSIVKDKQRTVLGVYVAQNDAKITLWIMGDGFLYNMVRIWAGTLIEVGTGYRAHGAIARAITTGNRLDLGVTAPAHGLTLHGAYYDETSLLADWNRVTSQ